MRDFYEPRCEQDAGNSESLIKDINAEFVELIAHYICEYLLIDWSQRQIFINLLISNMNRDFKNKLLNQFFNRKLERLAETFRTQFEIPDDISIDYGYADNAKFNSIIEYMKNPQVPQYSKDTEESK